MRSAEWLIEMRRAVRVENQGQIDHPRVPSSDEIYERVGAVQALKTPLLPFFIAVADLDLCLINASPYRFYVDNMKGWSFLERDFTEVVGGPVTIFGTQGARVA